MRRYLIAFSVMALLCCGAFGQSSGLPDPTAVHVINGQADKAFNLSDGSVPASQAYVQSAVAGAGGGGGTTTTNQVLDQKTTSAATWNKLCTASSGITNTGGGTTVACGGVVGSPTSLTVQTKQSSPVLNTAGVTGASAQYGLTVNSTSNTQILVPTTVGTNYTATVFKREMWFEGGSNVAGVDNFETDIYMFDQPDQWEYMMGWQCNRHNTGFWQYDNFKNGWTNTAVPCSIVSGHIYHYILWMHRDSASSTACSGKASTGDSSITSGPCEYWDTFQLDDLTASTSNTYTLNAKLVAEPASLDNTQTWTGIGSQIQIDVVDSSASSGNPQLVSMYVDDDTLTTYVPVSSSGSGTQTVTETTGNLGEYDFDGSNPAQGLTATGSPVVDTTNAYTSANAALFNASTQYYSVPLSASCTTCYFRTEFNLQSFTTGNSTQFLGLYSGSGGQLFNLYLASGSGYITGFNVVGGAGQTCESSALSAGYHRVELAWVAGSGTSGWYAVYIDGTQTCSVTGVNTGTSAVASVKFGQLSAPTTPLIFDMDNVGFSNVALLGAVTLGTSSTGGTALYDPNGAAAAAQTASLQKSANLGDLSNLGQAQSNIGVGILLGSETVAYSATPTFSVAVHASYIQLTGDVTTFTLPMGLDGQTKILAFCQDVTGGHAVTAPSNVHGFMYISTGANTCSVGTYTYFASAGVWLASGAPVVQQ